MAITKPPQKRTADSYIDQAPDAAAVSPVAPASEPKRVRKGRRVQITLTLTQPLLDQVDAQADRLAISRAAWINLAIRQGIDRGISLSGQPDNL